MAASACQRQTGLNKYSTVGAVPAQKREREVCVCPWHAQPHMIRRYKYKKTCYMFELESEERRVDQNTIRETPDTATLSSLQTSFNFHHLAIAIAVNAAYALHAVVACRL